MIPNIHYIIFAGLYIIAGSLITIIVTHLWINRKSLKPGLSLLVLFFIWIWLTTQLLEYIVPGLLLKSIFTTLRYIGIYLLPPAWVGFCYQYTTRKNKSAYLIIAVLSVIPLAALILTFTNVFHQVMWQNIFLHENRIKVVKEFTLIYYILLSYAYALIFTGFIILISMIVRKPHFQRRQTIILLLTAFIPISFHISEFFFSKALYNLELTPLAFSFASFIIIYFARLRYFRTIPLAQHFVIESMRDLLILVDQDNQIIYCNPSGSEIFTGPETTIAGKPLSYFLPSLAKLVKKIPLREFGSEEITIRETTYNVSVSPVYNWRRRLISRVINLRDITYLKLIEEDLKHLTNHLEARVIERTKELEDTNTVLKKEIIERKKIEKQLNDSLTDKTILLGEIHHRVKNNLQIIVSLLKLQKKYIQDTVSLEIFNTAISRIQSIAIIHEKLYKSEDIANTNLSDYIHELSHYILASHSEGIEPISLHMNVESIYLDINRSIHCGLIINELVINAIKYAFPPSFSKHQKEQKIYITFSKEDSDYILTVADNGVGVPEGIDIFQNDSLGMKIVKTLTHQLEGTLTVRQNSKDDNPESTYHENKDNPGRNDETGETGTIISIRFPQTPSQHA